MDVVAHNAVLEIFAVVIVKKLIRIKKNVTKTLYSHSYLLVIYVNAIEIHDALTVTIVVLRLDIYRCFHVKIPRTKQTRHSGFLYHSSVLRNVVGKKKFFLFRDKRLCV